MASGGVRCARGRACKDAHGALGGLIKPGEPWHLGHPDGESVGGPEHVACNTGAPSRLRARRQRRLLAHIRDVFSDEKITCAAVVDALNADDDLPYGGWSDGRGITTRELGWKLRPYGVKSKTIRIGDRFAKGYERDQFEGAWSRYLAGSDAQSRHIDTSGYPSQTTAEENRHADPLVAVLEEDPNPHEQTNVALVSVSKSESGDGGNGGRLFLGDPGLALQADAAYVAGHIAAGELRDLLELDARCAGTS